MNLFSTKTSTGCTPAFRISLRKLVSVFLVLLSIAEVHAQLQVLTPSDAGISLVSNNTYTVRWARGGTTFNRVRIKLSVDGGTTFPYLLANNTPSTASDSSEVVTVPGILTSQARIRVTNQSDSTVGDFSDNDFTITGYCWPWGMSCTNNFISNFTLNSLNSSSTCSARGYEVYSPSGTRTTNVYTGQNFNFTIKTSKTNPNMGVAIWCDFNDDQDFADAGEFLYASASLDTVHTGSISIPSDAPTGLRALRIRTVRANLLTSTDYCTFYNTGGEIEDYKITVSSLSGTGPIVVRQPNAAGINLDNNTNYTVRWSKGGTTFDRVRIKLSADGGVTYPYLLVNNTPSTPTDTSENIVVPGIITTQARIRVTDQNDSLVGDFSDNNFTIRGYCWPWSMSCTNNFISSFSVNTLNSSSTCSNRAYVNYGVSRTTTLYSGESYPFTLKTSKTNPNMGVGIWCDFNGDFDFDDAGEMLYLSSSLDTTFSGTLNIPSGLSFANRRLRIRTVQGNLLGAGDYCTFYNTGGEIEDYTVSVDEIVGAGPLVVRYPDASGITLTSNATATARWSKGGTTFDRVKIKFSDDGGVTFPYLLVNNTTNSTVDTSENFVVPGIITSQGRIQITNQNDSTIGDVSDNNFTITGYCWPWNTSCTNNFIRNVQLNTLDNTTTCSTRGYSVSAATGSRTTTLYEGLTYPISIKTSKNNTMGVGVWCDFNGDQDFEDDGEFLYASPQPDTTFNTNITVPEGVSLGQKRLRIRAVANTTLTASDYCTFFNNGSEIEDYTVSIDSVLGAGPLVVRQPNNPGISLVSNATSTAVWSKGGTTFSNVRIKLSADGGLTFPYLLVNNTPSLSTDTSENFVVPGIITNQARIRITNQADSTVGDLSDNDFAITGYCWPWSMSCTVNFIRQFNFNSLSRTSTCATRAYSNIAPTGNSTTVVYPGEEYSFTIKSSKTNLNHGAGIWCDLNGDSDFDDAGEFLYGSGSLDTTFTGTLTFPETATAGQRRLRVRTVQGSLLSGTDACTFFNTGGEIEDYTITVDSVSGTGPLVVRQPNDPGTVLTSNSSYTVLWSKGATTFGRVRIKFSADGGATFPYLLADNTPSTSSDTSENITVPGIITTQGRIRVANQNDSTVADISDNDFSITGYCWPWNMTCTNNHVRQFNFNTLARTSTCASTRGYTVITPSGATTTVVYPGEEYPFTIKTNKTNPDQGVGIWCDFNGDQDFDDAGEFLYGSPSLDTTFSGTVSIPESAGPGQRRLRVRTVRSNLLTSSDACSFFNTGGEIEDYTITVDSVAGTGPLIVRQPNAEGISLTSNATYPVNWSKGGTTYGRVRIKMSADGGVTYPYLLVDNTPNTVSDTTENIVVPGIITTQARIRITNQADSTVGDASDNNFAITGYCWPWGMSCTNNSINEFTLNTLARTSTCGNVRAYSVVAASGANTTTMQRGLSYPFTLNTSTTNSNMAVGIWCDFNNDQDFDDAGEFLYGSPSFGTSFSGNITIPQNTATGQRRLRIRTVRGTLLTSSDACTFFNTGGEIEDYTVTIIQPTIIISSILTDICAGSDLSVEFNTTGTFLDGNTYQVQISGPGGVFGAGTSVIGRGSSSPISCHIGLGTAAGTYRLRVVSSTPLPAVFGTNSATFNVRTKPASPTSSNVSRCGSGSVTLTAEGCSTMQWFDASSLGNLLGSGTSFVTPTLTSSRTYYVACIDGQGCQSLRKATTAIINPVPTISDISPTSGNVGFDNVVISGSGFNGLDSVVFSGHKKASWSAVSASSITVRVPLGAATGPIQVYTSCGSATSAATFTPVVPAIATPTIALAGGTYPGSTTTTLACATAGAEIYYTLDGTTPVPGTAITKKYSGDPVFIGNSLTLKAIGYREGWMTSGIAQEMYTISSPTIVADPVITPPTGSYNGGQLVTITCSTPESSIYFTLNGQVPVPGQNTPIRYLGPITVIDPEVTVRATAFRDGWAQSGTTVAVLTITGGGTLSPCTFSPLPGTYGTPQSVTITNPDPSAQIYFTTDGTDPYRYLPLARPYAGPVAINTSSTLKAQAFRDGFGDSPRTVGIYTIGALRMANPGREGSVYYAEKMDPANQIPAEPEVRSLETREQLAVSVHPNPTDGSLFIDFGAAWENMKITIFNVLGVELRQIQTDGLSFGAALSLKGQTPGVYIVRVSDSSGNSIDRKVVLR